jgi:hypothetical protein
VAPSATQHQPIPQSFINASHGTAPPHPIDRWPPIHGDGQPMRNGFRYQPSYASVAGPSHFSNSTSSTSREIQSSLSTSAPHFQSQNYDDNRVGFSSMPAPANCSPISSQAARSYGPRRYQM